MATSKHNNDTSLPPIKIQHGTPCPESPAGVMGHLVGSPALIHARTASEEHQQQNNTTTTIIDHITIAQHSAAQPESSSNMRLAMPPPNKSDATTRQGQLSEDSEPIKPLVCQWVGCELVFDEQGDMVSYHLSLWIHVNYYF